jgi:copper chaperone NosL
MKTFYKNLFPISFIVLVLFVSCKNEMRAINYGKDNCEQCRMTVMNPKFGAGILTSKGMVYTFDSGECLVRYVKSKGLNDKDKYYVSDYNKPGSLLYATNSSFLHGDSIQSPMGGNLAAFSDKASAQAVQNDLGGEIISWTELISKK